MPEHVVFSAFRALRKDKQTVEHGPGVLVVLGYYRTGTTHLHYLLSCDPENHTPTWSQVLAPQGFVVSWWVLKLLLMPFFASSRPQDDVAFGPEWPAEEDFACCATNLSSALVWRMVLPNHHSRFAGFHTLGGLGEKDLARWRRAQSAFCAKSSMVAGGRTLLLKSPSDTGRLVELARMFGEDRVRFVHITRERGAVVRSNLRLLERASMFHIDTPARADLRRRVEHELDETLGAYRAQKRALLERGVPESRFCEVGFDELVNDPRATVERVYRSCGRPITPGFAARMDRYLAEVAGYRSASAGRSATQETVKKSGRSRGVARLVSGGVGGVLAALCGVFAWFFVMVLLGARADWLAWPMGILIGTACARFGGKGSVSLGVVGVVLVLMSVCVLAVPGSWWVEYRVKPEPLRWEWEHIRASALAGATAWNSLAWVALGCGAAFRLGSRAQVKPPGG